MLASYEVSRASKYFGSGLAPDLIFIYGTITVFGLAFQLIQLIRTSHYVPYGRHMSVRNPCIPKAHTRLLNICTTEVEHQKRIKHAGLGWSRFARTLAGDDSVIPGVAFL